MKRLIVFLGLLAALIISSAVSVVNEATAKYYPDLDQRAQDCGGWFESKHEIVCIVGVGGCIPKACQ